LRGTTAIFASAPYLLKFVATTPVPKTNGRNMKLTKDELEKKVAQLEDELHVSQNSVDYWIEESDKWQLLYQNLKDKIDEDPFYPILHDCSLAQELALIDAVDRIL